MWSRFYLIIFKSKSTNIFYLKIRLNKTIVNYSDIASYMTVIDFSAHDDAITCLSMIQDPFSYMTSSKDKKVRIWSFDNQILGELNTAPSLNQIMPKRSEEWKFKVDWEKLKVEEISEVIKMFEDLGGTPVKFDESKLEEPVVETKKAEVKKKQEKVVVTNRRRFKPLEEYKKALIENNDDRENNLNIDDQYHQEIVDNINKVIYPNLYNVGLTEMAKNLLEGNKIMKEEEKDKGSKDKNLVENKTKFKVNKIQAIQNAPLKNINKGALFSEKNIRPEDKNSLKLPSITNQGLEGNSRISEKNVSNYYNKGYVSKLTQMNNKE